MDPPPNPVSLEGPDETPNNIAEPIPTASLEGDPNQNEASVDPIVIPEFKPKKSLLARLAVPLLIIIIITVPSVLVFAVFNRTQRMTPEQQSSFPVQQTNLKSLLPAASPAKDLTGTLTVNGQLQIAQSLQVSPTAKPTTATAGQIYYDKANNQLGYYNGKDYVYLQGGSTIINNNTTVVNNSTNSTLNNITNSTINTVSNTTINNYYTTPGDPAPPSVMLQGDSPGTVQSGNFNISGTGTIGIANIGTGNIATGTINTANIDVGNINTGNLGIGNITTATIGTGTINTATIDTATIATGTIDSATITSATIGTGTIDTATIDTGNITTATIDAATINSVTANSAAITTGTITTGTIGTGNITVGNIATGNIGTGNINVGNINTGFIGNGTITNATIGTGSITTGTIGTGTINNATIGTENVTTSTIGTGTITNGNITNATIGTEHVTTSTIGAATINSANVTTATIATGTITTATLGTATITTGNITTGNITTGNIGTGNITNATIGTEHVTTSTIGVGTIDTATINAAAIGTGNITTGNINVGNINTGVIGTGTITTATIGTGNITTGNVTNATIGTENVTTSTINAATINTANVTTAKISVANITTANISVVNTTDIESGGQTFTVNKFASLPSGLPVTAGDTAVGPSTLNTAFSKYATKVTLGSAGGPLQSVSVYITSPPVVGIADFGCACYPLHPYPLIVSIYADDGNFPSSPSTLMWTTQVDNTSMTNNSWLTLNTDNIPLQASTSYWVSVRVPIDPYFNYYQPNFPMATSIKSKDNSTCYNTSAGNSNPYGACTLTTNIMNVALNYITDPSTGPAGAALSLSGTGQAAFRNTADSPNAFKIQNATGSTIFNIDTYYGRIAVGKASADYTLDVGGDLNLANNAPLRFGGRAAVNGNATSTTVTGATTNIQGDTVKLQNAAGTTTYLTIASSGAATFAGAATIAGAATLSSTLGVTGATTLSGATSVGGVLTATGTVLNKVTSPTALQIQNASAVNLFVADTTNMVISVKGTDTTFANLTVTDAHVKSTQTTAPTIATPTNCGASATAAMTAGSTDTAGSFTITSGTDSTASTCDTTITFRKAYATAPKLIITVGNSSVPSTQRSIYVSAKSATNFTVTFGSSAAGANSTTYTFSYIVIE
jgi:hypothetical protein